MSATGTVAVTAPAHLERTAPRRGTVVPLKRVPGRKVFAHGSHDRDSLPGAADLREHLLFADLSQSQLARARDTGGVVALTTGQVLYERGRSARHFYLVIEGQVNLALHSRGGEEKIVEIIGTGQVFAEAVMFLEQPTYQLTAIAAMPTRVACFASETYLAILRENPDTCLRMLGHMSRRLHGRIRDIEHLTFESATDRLVRMLLTRMPEGEGPAEVMLAESRQELAAFLSMKPETLSRSLRALMASGAIEVHGRRVRVPSRARLKAQIEVGN
jgi:CRP/FNR family transcriptional regulator, dissimilatory nitrate respiration regulator